VPAPDSTTAIETVFRLEFGRLVAGLAGMVGDIELAEELAQEALVAAMEQWPREGTPRNPGAWLMTVGKRKGIDALRRRDTQDRKYRELQALGSDDDVPPDHYIEDDRLRLIFVACHPILTPPARVALTLRLLAGLTVAEIARAYLQPEATIAQRITRAKKTIALAGVPFEEPTGADRADRLAAVLEVVYLIFNEGYSATAGDDWTRPELCTEALRLGRQLAALAPNEAEVLGLVALMEIQASRLQARIGPDGEPVLLLDQDRRRWDRLHIQRGDAALARAEQLTSTPGPYALQAAIAGCHARAFRAEETDWQLLAHLYELLALTAPSPIVELNRAVAVSMAAGPAAGLDLADQVAATGTLDRYHLLYSVRGDLLERLGRYDEATEQFERAAALATNAAEKRLLTARARRQPQPVDDDGGW
jgi:RNA polymerase sigma factor (sigma-70 family)